MTTKTIDYVCGLSGTESEAPSFQQGRRRRCPGCREVLRVAPGRADRYRSSARLAALPGDPPTTSPVEGAPREDHLVFNCPACLQQGSILLGKAGSKVRCHSCQNMILAPRGGAALGSGGTARIGASRLRPRPEPVAVSRGPSSPYSPPQAELEPGRQFGTRRFQRDEVEHERHVRAIAVWQLVSSVFAGIALLVAAPFVAQLGRLGAPLLLLGGALTAASFLLGRGLYNYRQWSRWLFGLFQLLGVMGNLASLSGGVVIQPLIGLAWAGAVLWALFSDAGGRVFDDRYQAAVERSPEIRVAWWTSPFFYLPLVGTFLAFVLMFGAVAVMLGMQ